MMNRVEVVAGASGDFVMWLAVRYFLPVNVSSHSPAAISKILNVPVLPQGDVCTEN